MSSNITAGNVSINPPDEPVTFQGATSSSSSARQVIYTVPAGRTLYVTSVIYNYTADTRMRVLVSATVVLDLTVSAYVGGQITAPLIFAVESGQTLEVSNPTTTIPTWYTIAGYLL